MIERRMTKARWRRVVKHIEQQAQANAQRRAGASGGRLQVFRFRMDRCLPMSSYAGIDEADAVRQALRHENETARRFDQ